MNSFVDILFDRFGQGEPILTGDLLTTFSDVSEATVFNWLDKALEEETIKKYRRGVYYIPEVDDCFGLGEIPLSPTKIIYRKYVGDGDIVYGYISGLNLENEVGVSSQVPGTLEVTTNKESKRVREIEPFGGWRKITLRKPRVKVTKSNVNELRFLDLISRVPLSALDEGEQQSMKKLAKSINRDRVFDCLHYYPAKTAKQLIESEYMGVLT
jgi:hypothetical protein